MLPCSLGTLKFIFLFFNYLYKYRTFGRDGLKGSIHKLDSLVVSVCGFCLKAKGRVIPLLKLDLKCVTHLVIETVRLGFSWVSIMVESFQHMPTLSIKYAIRCFSILKVDINIDK